MLAMTFLTVSFLGQILVLESVPDINLLELPARDPGRALPDPG